MEEKQSKSANWQTIAAVAVVILTIFGYVLSIESRIAEFKSIDERSRETKKKVDNLYDEVLRLIDKTLNEKITNATIDAIEKDAEKTKKNIDLIYNEAKPLIDKMESSQKEAKNIVKELRENAVKIINITYVTKLGPKKYIKFSPEEDTGSRALESRLLRFDKHKENSIIRIGYTDTFQAHGKNKACRWEIKIDGLSCPSGKLIYGRHDGKESNIHDSNHIIGYCENISKGKHNIQIWVGPHPGDNEYSYKDSYCATGWGNNRWTLEALEIEQ